LTELVRLFLNNLLPILLMAGAGYFLGRWLHVNPRPVSQVVLHLFIPCLVFKLLTENELESGDVLRMVGFALATMCVPGILAWFAGRFFRFERSLAAAVVLSVTFNNSGNYGLPLNLFAFGESAMAQASLYFITNLILVSTLGVLIASMGTSTLRVSVQSLVRLPTLYALVFAVLFLAFGLSLPGPLDVSVDMFASAAIPGMLVLLGLQLKQSDWKGEPFAVGLASVTRLVISPLIAIGLAFVFGLQGVARQAGILEAAMPVAVLTAVVASEYDTKPKFVTTVVLITTLLSPFTLTPLLAFLAR